MHLLYFWRGDVYRQDLRSWDHFHLSQNSTRMRDVVAGEHLWAFTRNRKGRYVLAADLVVTRKVHNPPGSRYGKYRVYGDLVLTRYFAVEDAPDVESLIRPIARAQTAALGQSFQGRGAVREITEDDHAVLTAFAQSLALEPVIHGPPSRPFQYHIPEVSAPQLVEIVAEPGPLYGVVDRPTPRMSPARREYLLRRIYERNPALVDKLQDLYDGRCQLCQWEPKASYRRRLCEGHHIHWLSLGGLDALDNLMLVCPNHHRAIHATEAQLDFAGLEMDFGTHRETIQLNEHIAAVT